MHKTIALSAVLAIAVTTLQAMAERRVERLVNPDLSHGLPAFLVENPGLRGLPQYDGLDAAPRGDDLIQFFTDAFDFPLHNAIIA